jgi:hypothetical protein
MEEQKKRNEANKENLDKVLMKIAEKQALHKEV